MAAPLIGLMSGTSLDGVDGVLVSFQGSGPSRVDVHAHVHRPFPAPLASVLLALHTAGDNELHRAGLAANALAGVYAEVVQALIDQSGLTRAKIRAVGAHGQTVRHRPGEFDGIGYTCQLNAPALLAERCGLPVVADFRSRDVAAGGQGAPLVPAFHRAVFGRAGRSTAVLNLGGIANLTLIPSQGETVGFDTGPANVLLDLWCARCLGRPYDAGGEWAAKGQVLEDLLARMLADVYFTLPAPKSTGRDRFNAEWLDAHLASRKPHWRDEDVQRTLLELTLRSIELHLRRYADGVDELLVCGGGALNDGLLTGLGAALPGIDVLPTDMRGLPCMQVEACAFAWLAQAFLDGSTGNLRSVTGALGERILGALYPA